VIRWRCSWCTGQRHEEESVCGVCDSPRSDAYQTSCKDFLSALQQKDRLIGARLWVDVLYPLRSQWKEWRTLRVQNAAVENARESLQRAYAVAQCVNNPQV
jgi:hypothetical protein